MNTRERFRAIMHYEDYDALPVCSFGYWGETLQKWHQEGHLTDEDMLDQDGTPAADRKLGFELDYIPMIGGHADLMPYFEEEILAELPGGLIQKRDQNGLIVQVKKGIVSIPSEVGHTLVDRKSWEELYLPRLQPDAARIDPDALQALAAENETRETPLALYCGSLFGKIRDWMGVEGTSYLLADDEELYREIIDTMGNLVYDLVEQVLASGVQFDVAHYWEDICFKNGPLVIPSVFDEMVGPHYRRVSDLLRQHGVDIVSLDCDGWSDSLIPTWIENGVNTMFPIEVGTWNASLAPWRAQYGKELRGVGGMNKLVFAYDYAAIDKEIERLKPLVALGGYLPCPDHRIPPDAKWENVQYYCDRMHRVFG